MVQKVAAWVIFEFWGNKRVAKVRYSDKTVAEELLEKLGKDRHYLQLVKEPVTDLPGIVTVVITSERVVRGVSENRRTGERRAWSKIFNDLEVYTLHDEKYLICDKFTVHRHRRRLCVVNFKDFDEFEEHVRKKWPKDFPSILIRALG